MVSKFSKNSNMSSIKSNPSTTTSPFITPVPEFYFPIPFGAVTPETQPLLQYQRHTLRSRSSIHHPTDPFTKRPQRSGNGRKMIWSGIFQLQIISAMFMAILIGFFVLRQLALRAVHDSHTLHFESPGHYQSSTIPHNANPQTGFEHPILSSMQEKELDPPQLRGIEFAVFCFVVFIIASGYKCAGYLMTRWDSCVGCDGSEIIDEYSEEELEQGWRWGDGSFGRLTRKDGSSDEKGDQKPRGCSQALSDGDNMV